jgi:multidrug efflux pump subunit AcrA (membrane-fusion protein)
MKTTLPWILSAVLGAALVAVVVARPATPAPSQKKALYYVDPMHPQYKSDKPGKAPDCGMDLVPVYDEPKSAIAPQTQQLIGVQMGVAEVRELGRSIRAVGRVAVDETRLSKVTAKFDGYIEKLYVNVTGEAIRKGQPLFTVYSPDLLATQQEYLLALRAAKESPTLLAAARQRLLLWDVTPAEIRELERSGAARKSVTIYAPASGVVMNKMAVAGARITAGEPLFEIANLDRVWIQADVYESDLPFLRRGARATTTLSYLPGRTWTGRVTFIAPIVDPMTRTVKVRSEFDNADAALKPDMFTDVVIEQPTRKVISVPDSAVLQTGTRNVVYVVQSDGTYDPRAVEIGVKEGDLREIRGGLVSGERVVTAANFLVDSEARLRANQKAEGREQK